MNLHLKPNSLGYLHKYSALPNNMNEQLMGFWEEMDTKIYDLIQLIRLRHPNFNSTPADKVVLNLYNALQAAYDVQDAIAKGWLK